MILKWGAIAGFWLILVAGALAHRYAAGAVEVGAGYVAKEACSCIFIGGRELESCRHDMPDMMDDVDAEVLADERAVRAFVTGLGERIARFEPDGGGCTLY